MTIWLYVWYVCKSVKPAGFHCDDILSALVTLFSWVVKALNMSGFFYQDVFGPMPTDWLFPDRSRLAKVVESWVKEGGGVAALRHSPLPVADGCRATAAAAAAGLRRGEAQGGGHELCTYVHRSRSVLVLTCPYLLAWAAAGRAAPSAPGCWEPVSHGSTLCCRPALALMVRLSLAPAAAACGARRALPCWQTPAGELACIVAAQASSSPLILLLRCRRTVTRRCCCSARRRRRPMYTLCAVHSEISGPGRYFVQKFLGCFQEIFFFLFWWILLLKQIKFNLKNDLKILILHLESDFDSWIIQSMVINLCQGVLCCQAFAMIYNLPVPMFFGTPNNLLVHSEVRWALPCSSAARVVALLPPPPAPFQLPTQELSVGTAAAATPWRRRGRRRLRRRQRSVDRSVGRWDEIAKQPAHKRGSRKAMLCATTT